MTNRFHSFLSSHLAPLEAAYVLIDEDTLNGARRPSLDIPDSVGGVAGSARRARRRHVTH